MVTPYTIAVVPARGGSKSIPRKNLKAFAGHPLVAWAIASGREAELVDRVIVSTDDPEIADVSREYGADVPFLRPAEFATDEAPDLPLFLHLLEWLAREGQPVPTAVVQIRPTSPLRPIGLVDLGVRVLQNNPDCDSVRAVALSSQTPYKMWRIVNGRLVPLLEHGIEPYNQRRQDLPEAYWQTGHLDAVRTNVITEKRSMTGDLVRPLVVDQRYAHDLDTLRDWELAELAVADLDDLLRP